MERNINVREKYQLVAFHMHPNGTRPTTQACVLTGTEPGPFDLQDDSLFDCHFPIPHPHNRVSYKIL